MFAKENTSEHKNSSKSKPQVKNNKFVNLTPQDWKDSNDVTKSTRGLSSITYEDI